MSVSSASDIQEVTDVSAYARRLAASACGASPALASAPGDERDRALASAASQIAAASDAIAEANAADLEAGRAAGLADATLDRLALDEKRIEKLAGAVRDVAAQPDPVGTVLEGRVLANGIRLERVRVPLGTVMVVYESRPNVTADAAALCIKSGNSAILRGGREAFHTNRALAACMAAGLADAGLPEEAVRFVETTDRAAVTELLRMEQHIDLVIPRGGASLIEAVAEQARIPVIKHYAGNCHVYVDADCDDAMAEAICLNAKTQRYGVCNAAETLLFHRSAAERGLLARVAGALAERGVTVRADAGARAHYPAAEPASESDWSEEFLGPVVAIGVCEDLDAAIDHVNRYGSHHTDAIVTEGVTAAERFLNEIDAANVFLNCSTRFSDGGQYGLGAEIGISTDKLHARGPMGAADLTTYKWIARGSGQIRE